MDTPDQNGRCTYERIADLQKAGPANDKGLDVYKEWYIKGWKADQRGSDMNAAEGGVAQKVGLWSFEMDAWTDGYLDSAHGLRGKWHRLHCDDDRHANGDRPDICHEA